MPENRYNPINQPAARGTNTPNRRITAGAARRRAATVRGKTASRRRVTQKRIVQRRGSAVKGAQNQLKRFRQGSILAIAITGFILMLFVPAESGYSQDTVSEETVLMVEEDPAAGSDTLRQDPDASDEELDEPTEPLSRAARDEAVGAFQNLWNRFNRNLPKLLVALAVLVAGWIITRLLRWGLRKITNHWERGGATIAVVNIFVWLFAIGLAISIVVGDIRAMVGSLGLIGLALSWSLQSPIESFTGWLINSFKGYYRIGDRISVGDVVGDVYKIDFLTTTVWEIGSAFRQGYLQAEQPTGRLVTFPNNEVLAGSVVNYTSDFPFVWDELSISIANESDIRLSMDVLEKTANGLLSPYMQEPARQYALILQRAGLPVEVSEKPQVFLALNDSWTDVIIRYLVAVRERRKWKTELIKLTAEELSKSEHIGKIIPVYPRQQIQLINPGGVPVSMDTYKNMGEEGTV